MGRLKRYIANQHAIEWRSSEDPPILQGEEGLVEIVDADGLDKPQSQLDAETDAFKLSLRTLFAEIVEGSTPEGFAIRTQLLTILDETNRLRAWITSFKAAVASATSLGNLQTRVAALGSLPEVSGEQLKAALAAKAESGLAD